MASFAAEAALAGKPSVVCGYYSENLVSDVPSEFHPPTHFCHPNSLLEAIEELIKNENYRLRLGAEARQFVREHWSPAAVAMRYLTLASGQRPHSSWIYRPERNRYFKGMGLSQDTLRLIVKGYLARYGDEALGIDHAPLVKQSLLKFVGEE